MVYSKAVKDEIKIYTNSWGFCRHTIITAVWKTRYISDMSFIMQAFYAYQHSAPIKGLLWYAGYNHDKDHTII